MRVRAARHVMATASAAVAVIVSLASPAFAQTADPPQTTPVVQAPERPPNLDRIREAVTKPPELKIDNGQLRIYV